MGRVKSSIPKGSFSLKTEKNPKGEQHVYLKYYVEGKYVKTSTNIWLFSEDWDDKHQKVRSRNKQHARFNGILENLKRKIDNKLMEYDEGVITADVVRAIFNGHYQPEHEKAKSITFIDYCHQINNLKYERDDYGHSVHYNNKLNIEKFHKFIRSKRDTPLSLSQINRNIVDEYVAYLLNDKKLGVQTIDKYLTCIIQAVQYAKDYGQLDVLKAQSIIDNVRPSKVERTYNPDNTNEDEVRYLNDEQMAAFIAYQPKSNRAHRTEEFKEIFMFSFYSCGLRISDIITLEWENIDFEKQAINKIQVKTKKKGTISPRLAPQAIEILKKWKEKEINNRFVFNFLPENFIFGKSTEAKLKMKINSATKTINTSLNYIGKAIELPFSLSIHVARHTFCVKALSSSMSLHIVSQLMGHSSTLATEKTYAHYLEDTIDGELKKLDNIYK